MAQLVCITSDVVLSRKSGTIQLREKNGDRKALIPVIQTSEIFALQGAEPDEPLLSLLSQHAIPLHVFQEGTHAASYLPYASVLSGASALAQIHALEDPDHRWKLARELLRGCARMRIMAARLLRPKETELWENAYLDCLVDVYHRGLEGIPESLNNISAIDEDLLRRQTWSHRQFRYASDIGKAVVLGALSKLSLDPWIGILTDDGDIPPLAADLLFLFAPIIIWLWPPEKRPAPGDAKLPDTLRRHLARPAATTGERIWSIRYLPVREGYALLRHFIANAPYRCASKVEVTGP